MIRPPELDSDQPHGLWPCRGSDVWDMICAAISGDVAAIRRLIARDANLFRSGYWYTQPIHFAVREGHVEAVRALLEAGADPTFLRHGGDDLVTTATDRGHHDVARLILAARQGRPQPVPVDHEIHAAASRGETDRVRALLDADPSLISRADHQGRLPLHLAVSAAARDVIGLLLDRGADIHAPQGAGGFYAATGFQPIDIALWNGPFYGVRGDLATAGLLIERGAGYPLTIAAALGDHYRVKKLLDEDPMRISETRPQGIRPLSAAIQFGHATLASLLLERGADPNWPEGSYAPRGISLHVAASAGDRAMVELLLAHGADPNGVIDSAGSATYAAKTPELRSLLQQHGGRLDAYDLIWLGEDEEALRRVTADPASADAGCGGVFAAACTMGKNDLVRRLLAAGARVPPVLTACRSYLWSQPETLRMLLESGMNPDLPDWQRSTPLHQLCSRDGRGRAHEPRLACAAIFLEFGATIDARDEEYRSTPLGWAARTDLPDMVEFLLARGAVTSLPDDESWATPLAWATRRGHAGIETMLRRAGAAR